LFPNLHSMTNTSVTKKISLIIQGAWPIGIPKPLKDEYTAKSVHRGVVSELLMYVVVLGTISWTKPNHMLTRGMLLVL
jgi:hypothetical protein